MSQIINNGKKYKNRSKQGQHKIYKSLSIILVIIMILFLYPYKTTYNIQNQSTYLPKFNNASINITFNVINDEYSGSYGLWALGNYTKNIRAMPIGNYSYLAKVTENGTWRTFNGLKSPGKGLIEPSNGAGVFHEVYYAQVPGDLNSTLKSYGFIGTYNFNGSYQRLLAFSFAFCTFSAFLFSASATSFFAFVSASWTCPIAFDSDIFSPGHLGLQ